MVVGPDRRVFCYCGTPDDTVLQALAKAGLVARLPEMLDVLRDVASHSEFAVARRAAALLVELDRRPVIRGGEDF